MAFVGMVALGSDKLGFALSESQLEGYVYLWRCIGRQLAVEDRLNLCGGGAETVRAITREAIKSVVFPQAAKPCKAFYDMADAYIGGMNLLFCGLPLLSVRSTIAVSYYAADDKWDEMPFELSALDYVRYLNYRFLFVAMRWLPFSQRLASALLVAICLAQRECPSGPPSSCPLGGAPAGICPELHPAGGCPGDPRPLGAKTRALRAMLLTLVLGSVLLVWLSTAFCCC